MLLVLAESKAAITSNAHTLPELMHRCLGTVDVDVAGYNELQGIYCLTRGSALQLLQEDCRGRAVSSERGRTVLPLNDTASIATLHEWQAKSKALYASKIQFQCETKSTRQSKVMTPVTLLHVCT